MQLRSQVERSCDRAASEGSVPLEAIGAPVLVLDPLLRVLERNAAAASLFGWADPGAPGTALTDLLAGGEGLGEVYRDRLAEGDAVHDVVEVRVLGGSTRSVALAISPMVVDRTTNGYVALLADVGPTRALHGALTRETARTRVLQQVVRHCVGSRTAVEAVQGSLERIVQGPVWDVGHAHWLEGQGSADVVGTAVLGPDAAAFGDATHELRHDGGDPLVLTCAALDEPVFVPDLAGRSDFRRRDEAVAAGLRTGVLLPVHQQGRVVAVLELFSLRPGRVDVERERRWLLDVIGVLEATISRHGQARDLQRSRDLFEAIVHADVAAQLVVGSDGVVRFANAAAERVLGTRLEGRGLGWFDLTLLDELDRPLDAEDDPVRQVLTGTGVPARREYRVRRPDGAVVDVVLTAAGIRDGDGEVTDVVVAFLDVGELKHVQRQLRQRSEEAQAANAAKSNFLSRMSHELRTPMHAVLGFAQLIRGGTEDPDIHRFAEHVTAAGSHLVHLIDEVVDIARIETGRMSLSLEPVALAGVLHEVAEMLAPQARARDVTVEVAVEDGVEHCAADLQRLRQVLVNLVGNAIKYGHDGGNVTLTAFRVDGRVRTEVADDGPGIPREHQHRVFAPFDRLGHENGDVEGLGLGLTLSRDLARAMGGDLMLRSEPGAGATFVLDLGAAEPPVLLDRPSATSRGERHRTARRVLAVEDNPANVELLREAIAMVSDHALLVAGTGAEGIALARRSRPDVVLLDLDLPDMSGLDVLRELRADDDLAGLPVIVATADATRRHETLLEDLGVQAYLIKPLDLHRLLDELDRAGAP